MGTQITYKREIYFQIVKPFFENNDIPYLSNEYLLTEPSVFTYSDMTEGQTEALQIILQDHDDSLTASTVDGGK